MADTGDNRMEHFSTGVYGLDEVLSGGLDPAGGVSGGRGRAGQGKTTLGLHFLTAPEDASALFIGFQEPEEQLRANAASVGIDVSQVRFHCVLVGPQ